jgi:glycosyltransferase involved in cell wall biosynthesis
VNRPDNDRHEPIGMNFCSILRKSQIRSSARRGSSEMLNIFYEEPDADRWFPFDRYPRRIARRLLRGEPKAGGQRRVFLNLCAGLERIGAQYRINDYGYVKNHPDEIACIVGKPFVLDKVEWKNPILFGAAIYSHPLDDPNLLQRLPIRKVLVPGPWMKDMCKPYWGDAVDTWPVGIDTDLWRPQEGQRKTTDVLLYDKVRWEHDRYDASLIEPIRAMLRKQGQSVCELRYGFYREDEFRTSLARCRTMIFLCEHETQGIAYQQALSCDVPILAWDRGGYWQDPGYYPRKVKFQPVTAVPYWDDRCGLTFGHIGEFGSQWERLWGKYRSGQFRPREYILETLTLERSARRYLEFVDEVRAG